MAVGERKVHRFAPNGTLIEVLDRTTDGNDTGGDIAGLCFDVTDNLYTTNFGSHSMSKFNNKGGLLQANFGSGASFFAPESCAFDGFGNLYVGQATNQPPNAGEGKILKFDQNGNLLATYTPAIGPRGSDWLDVAADSCTILYASEGDTIRRFNACTNTQLSDFCSGCGDGLRGLRIRPDGSVLAASTDETVIRLFDSSGGLIRSYDAAGLDRPESIGLDPDGTSFWTYSIPNHTVFRFDIATGDLKTQFDSGTTSTRGFGIAVFRGPAAAPLPMPSALSAAKVWVGLKNSDAVGARFDLKAEVFKNGMLVGSGQINNVRGGSSGFNNAVLSMIDVQFLAGPMPVPAGTTLAIKVSARITCFGSSHNSATARLWFDGQPIDSGSGRKPGTRVNAANVGASGDRFLRNGFTLSTTAGNSNLFVDAPVAKSAGACPARPFKAFGTWSGTF